MRAANILEAILAFVHFIILHGKNFVTVQATFFVGDVWDIRKRIVLIEIFLFI
jgi:hypothetical protein